MQKLYALVQGNVVQSLIMATDELAADFLATPTYGIPVEVTGEPPNPGWIWDGENFAPPPMP